MPSKPQAKDPAAGAPFERLFAISAEHVLKSGKMKDLTSLCARSNQ